MSVGWTLFFEMFFYALFACALALRISEFRFLAPLMIGLVAIGSLRTADWPAVTVLASPLLLEFLAGVAIAKAVTRKQIVPSWLSLPLGIIGTATLLLAPSSFMDAMGGLIRETCAVLVVLALVMYEAKSACSPWRFLLLVGDASYSLYLSHLLLFALLTKAAVKLGLLSMGKTLPILEVLCVAPSAVPAVYLSMGLYRWVEQPLAKVLRPFVRTDTSSPIHENLRIVTFPATADTSNPR